MNSKFLVAATLGLAATAFTAHAQMKPEDAIKQRRSGYAVIGFNFSSLGAMAQDKKPYNKEEAIRNAELVAALADYPKNFFLPGTDKGADTKAKPEIWQKRADFDKKMDEMITEAKKLPQVARNGDLAALKKAVGDTGGKCKACHDDYRAK
jgi:cytochrome c556